MSSSPFSKPVIKPKNPRFSSGPTTKYPGWKLSDLEMKSLGRSHRSPFGLERINHMIDLTREVLAIPDSHLIAMVPGSCTGAIESAMWNLLGERPVEFLRFDVFGQHWVRDGLKELNLNNVRVLDANVGELPDLNRVDFTSDVVLTWNGTTTGVCIPDGEWIPHEREGLVICDAVSALFAINFPWEKVDAVAFSWQKGLGGEAAHGMLVLSPRAVSRINTYNPPWPIPKLFRLKWDGLFSKRIFEGMTINTPSLLCIEECIASLNWSKKLGGLPALIARSQANLAIMEDWVAQTPWVEFVAKQKRARSSTSICLQIGDDITDWKLPKEIATLLDAEGAAHDILGHKDSAPCLRIWGGPTVEKDDIQALFPWLEWAYRNVSTS